MCVGSYICGVLCVQGDCVCRGCCGGLYVQGGLCVQGCVLWAGVLWF